MSTKTISDKPSVEPVERLPEVMATEQWLRKPGGTWSVGQLQGSSAALLLDLLWHKTGRNLLVVVEDQASLYRWLDDLQFFSDYFSLGDSKRILPLPHPENLPYEIRQPDPTVHSERLGTLREVLFDSGEPVLIVAPVRSIVRKLPGLEFWRGQCRPMKVGQSLNRAELINWLSEEGFEFRDLISGPGEYSVRGGIVDLFAFDSSYPVRIELFGDEIDSIRVFDLVTQRSCEKIEETVILPANEGRLIREAIEKEASLGGLVELLSERFVVVYDDLPQLEVEAARMVKLVERMYHEVGQLRKDSPAEDLGEPPVPPAQLYLDWDGVQRVLRETDCLSLSDFAHPIEEGPGTNLEIRSADLPQQGHKAKLAELVQQSREGGKVWIVCDNDGQKHRLEELLGSAKSGQEDGAIQLPIGALHQGFAIPSIGWIWTTDRQIFGRYKRVRQRAAKGVALPIVDLVELKPGDYVVHIDQGIARYRGLKQLDVEGKKGEFLELEYADEATLYVPIEQIERIGRYVGSSAAPPALSKLGGKGWQNAKEKARKAIENMAGELLELYAERSVRGGHAFGPDTAWQHEFEASFLYEETVDQLRSIDEVKRDMQSPHPMDRLVCGDVGFGKTEVALRAAFKAVMEGNQVAILVPTTILAEQHFRTFRERLADYPVAVELLSRFRTNAEQKRALELLAQGKIDIVIGTHRLLQKDVSFRNLGLVIIDEEQRFGVKHKERLKQMRTLVDCLTLTATPIPRTLYMAMNGVRDMSIVNTPPKDRLPIQTYVYEWSHEVIESAILREMARGGQVYFVHNRVQSIGGIAEIIAKIVPEARIAIGHGQMHEKQLAQVMRDFIDGKYDVLLSTTIIESGLDIPNVNTIVINRADAFGLAELYQLRGRVGRDRHRAYCYLLVPSKGTLSRVARQRLLALQEFNQLGSGFQLALRDMEIRGIGNLLGREQHGHIAAVGFDLYSKLLSETVDKLTGRSEKRYPEPQIEIVPQQGESRGQFGNDYVPSAKLRMSLYKRLAALQTEEEVEEFRKEISDLYGPPPDETEKLLESRKISIAAWRVGVDRVKIEHGQARLRYCEQAAREHFSPELVIELDRVAVGTLTVSIKDGVVLTLRPKTPEWQSTDKLIREVGKILHRIGQEKDRAAA